MKKSNRYIAIIALLLIGIGGLALSAYAPSTTSPLPKTTDAQLLDWAYQHSPVKNRPIIPIPETLPLNPKEVALGQRLFFDPRLSVDNSVSCATCHPFKHAGADPRPVSLGVKAQKGELNSPPVFNAVFNFAQFWDGRAKDLPEQAEGPLFNPVEMANTSWETLLNKLQAIPDYQRAFQTLYPDQGLTRTTLTYSIAQFERSLITPNNPFDRYLKGELSALSPQARQGYRLFQSKGCIACHNGINIGGNLFQRVGIYAPIHSDHHAKPWLGRYLITHDPADKYFLKVPSLRNIALTAPYLHDGSQPNLKDTIKLMANKQLGQPITDEETLKLEAFLNSLTGEYQGVPLNAL